MANERIKQIVKSNYPAPIVKIIDNIEGKKFQNLKTGGIYNVEQLAICATNSLDGQIDVIYKNDLGYVFTRELGEFLRKFKYYEGI